MVRAEPARALEPFLIDAMCRTIVHRGPDEQGIYVQGHVGLGSRRLSIIDLEGGKQPIHNEDKTIWIVSNGEIYNYPALTRTLEQRGHRFYTRSDTETIIHAYEEFGDEFLHHLNGMFGFALWDARRQRLVLARDRIGIKPLYYTFHDNTLIFASELKAILAYPHTERNIDLVALNDYLSYEYVPAPRTIFQDIFKLPPGHALSFCERETEIWQYWDIDLAHSETIQPKEPVEYESEVQDVLREVVRQEMVSDVPIGVLLSGGIDSSGVAALMAESTNDEIQSFSIGFDDPSFDESHHALQVARHLGTKHRELTLTPGEMLDLIPAIAEFLDEPFGDSSFIPTYLLAKFAREHVKVALGGDGGDELFAGYSTLQAHRLMDYYERLLPRAIRRQLVPWVVDRLPVSFDNISFDFKARRFISGQDTPTIERHHLWLGSFAPAQKIQLLRNWAQLEERETYRTAVEHLQASGAQELINQVLYCDMKLYLEGDILTKVDRASMANSLEVRVPLLNNTLVEYVAAIPHELKLHRLTRKYIMRKALRGLVPDNILRRGKKGFNIPVAKWLLGPLRPLAEEMFSEERLKREGFFQPAYVRGLLEEHLAGRQDNRKLLWTLLVFQLWHERWG
jgi:asparagine synthase (glutamine-hydrolysing)